MSRVAMWWAYEAGIAAKLDAVAIAVLQSLAYHANTTTGRSDPSAATIGREIRRHEGNIRRAFERIEEAGILKGQRRPRAPTLWIFPVEARYLPRDTTPVTARKGPRYRALAREEPVLTSLNLTGAPAGGVDIYARLPNWTADRLRREGEP